MVWDSLPRRRRPRGPVKRESATYVGCGGGRQLYWICFPDLASPRRPTVPATLFSARADDVRDGVASRHRPDAATGTTSRRWRGRPTRRDRDVLALNHTESGASDGIGRVGRRRRGRERLARRHRLPSSYRYKRAALGRDDDAAAAMRPVQRPRVRRADRAPLMFVDCISVASVVVEAASRPRHLRACRCKKRQQRTLPVSLKLARRPLTACSGS